MADQNKMNIGVNSKKLKGFFSSIKIARKDQVQWVLFLTVILSALFIYLLFLPVKNNYKSDLLNYDNTKIQYDALAQKRDALNALAKEKTDRADFLSKVLDVMPQTSQVPEVLIALEKYASDDNLALTDFTPREEAAAASNQAGTPKPNYNKVSLNFDLTGSYENLKLFLKDIEDNIRPINIINIGLSGGGQISNTSAETLHFRVSAEVYYENINQ